LITAIKRSIRTIVVITILVEDFIIELIVIV